MKKTIQALVIVFLAVGLILTSCQPKTLVPDGTAVKGSGDSIKRLVYLIDCTLMEQVTTSTPPPQNKSLNPDTSVIKGMGTNAILLISPIYSRTFKLVESYKLLKHENEMLQSKLKECTSGTNKNPLREKQ